MYVVAWRFEKILFINVDKPHWKSWTLCRPGEKFQRFCDILHFRRGRSDAIWYSVKFREPSEMISAYKSRSASVWRSRDCVRFSIIKALSIRSASRSPFSRCNSWASHCSKRLSALAARIHFRRDLRPADGDSGNRVTFTHCRRLHYISSVARRLATGVIKNDVKRAQRDVRQDLWTRRCIIGTQRQTRSERERRVKRDGERLHSVYSARQKAGSRKWRIGEFLRKVIMTSKVRNITFNWLYWLWLHATALCLSGHIITVVSAVKASYRVISNGSRS